MDTPCTGNHQEPTYNCQKPVDHHQEPLTKSDYRHIWNLTVTETKNITFTVTIIYLEKTNFSNSQIVMSGQFHTLAMLVVFETLKISH